MEMALLTSFRALIRASVTLLLFWEGKTGISPHRKSSCLRTMALYRQVTRLAMALLTCWLQEVSEQAGTFRELSITTKPMEPSRLKAIFRSTKVFWSILTATESQTWWAPTGQIF